MSALSCLGDWKFDQPNVIPDRWYAHFST